MRQLRIEVADRIQALEVRFNHKIITIADSNTVLSLKALLAQTRAVAVADAQPFVVDNENAPGTNCAIQIRLPLNTVPGTSASGRGLWNVKLHAVIALAYLICMKPRRTVLGA